MPFGFAMALALALLPGLHAEPPATPAAPPVPPVERPTRMAVLHFGSPPEAKDRPGDVVGVHIWPEPWERAIPLLEEDKIDVVVIRVNSSGGFVASVPSFHDLFEGRYKKKFRTVAWLDSAIGPAAMSVWVLDELYMLPDGVLGACVVWKPPGNGISGPALESYLKMMLEASRRAGRDHRVMRSMQIMEPLSADIDERGGVAWFQNLSGHYVLNDGSTILTLNARNAAKFRVARAIASTRDDLAAAMGLKNPVFAGFRAAESIDESMRKADRAAKRLEHLQNRYYLAFRAAAKLHDPDLRTQEIDVARRALADMKELLADCRHVGDVMGLSQAWFKEQQETLDRLAAR